VESLPTLRQLEMRGFKVTAGKLEIDNRVMVFAGSYHRIVDAVKHGLLTDSTLPPQKANT
jgi:hypothetical protein